ncbi:GTPase Era [Candidatus Gottesmanbacteria bacterium]|nr:GTPase Era [Candidatus Gottesmanbacteria bacterium]
MKSGYVALIGRPNAGKSTLLNAIIGQKVAITSPKPQTTRFPIQAVYQDDRGQIVFIDTPGIFGKVVDEVSRRINPRAGELVAQRVDLVIYLIDHTRKRDFEENVALGIVRQFSAPKILVVNKIDIDHPDHRVQYKFMEEEFDDVVEVSAIDGTHVPTLVEKIFSYLPEGEPLVRVDALPHPTLNLDSKTYLAELIREKAFLFLRREVPYKLTAIVDNIEERDNGALYIKARILTSADRYKSMIIGKGGRMIKEIGMATRKELEGATDKKVFLELTVETDPHWVDYL